MCNPTLERIRESRGSDAAYREACELLRRNRDELDALFASRFFEVRVLADGSKKLWPCTEESISRAIDLQDCEPESLPAFLFCDVDGHLYPVTIGPQQRHEPDPDGPDVMPFVYASSALVANGKAVGSVSFTDH